MTNPANGRAFEVEPFPARAGRRTLVPVAPARLSFSFGIGAVFTQTAHREPRMSRSWLSAALNVRLADRSRTLGSRRSGSGEVGSMRLLSDLRHPTKKVVAAVRSSSHVSTRRLRFAGLSALSRLGRHCQRGSAASSSFLRRLSRGRSRAIGNRVPWIENQQQVPVHRLAYSPPLSLEAPRAFGRRRAVLALRRPAVIQKIVTRAFAAGHARRTEHPSSLPPASPDRRTEEVARFSSRSASPG